MTHGELRPGDLVICRRGEYAFFVISTEHTKGRADLQYTYVWGTWSAGRLQAYNVAPETRLAMDVEVTRT